MQMHSHEVPAPATQRPGDPLTQPNPAQPSPTQPNPSQANPTQPNVLCRYIQKAPGDSGEVLPETPGARRVGRGDGDEGACARPGRERFRLRLCLEQYN